jgi:hypothetical protein
MNEHPDKDIRVQLARIVEAALRPARLALLLDERQPDALRAEAVAMPPERLWWTLTQLDDGLPLPACQALVGAVRLSRGRPPRPDAQARERRSAVAAATAVETWARRRLISLPVAVELARWLADAAQENGPARSDDAPGSPASGPAARTWLDMPPLVGPPPGADDPSLTARFRRRLRGLGPGRRHGQDST